MSKTVGRQIAYAAVFSASLLTAACTLRSGHGPVNSVYFESTVDKSLAEFSGGKVHEALRGNWIPYKKKDRIRGIFAVTAKGLVFASWNDPLGRYHPKYRVAYQRLNTVRIHQEQFQKRLRAETQSGRVDYFEILTQSPSPPYIVNNDLTEDVFELLKNIKREQHEKSRGYDAEEIDFRKMKRDGHAKRRALKKKRRRYRDFYDDDY